jgi:hypothetical protein
MKQLHHTQATDAMYAMVGLLDQFATGVDPDFDDGQEELERQFAELRLSFDHT